MTVAFVFVERRAENPIMPPSIYANRVVSISLIAVFITGFGMFGSIIFIPLFFQGRAGCVGDEQRLVLTPMMLSMVVAATLSGQALSRLGGHYRIQGLVGIAVMTAGIALTSRVTAETSFGQAVAGIVVTGLGLGRHLPKLHDRRAERGCAQPAWRRDLRDSVLSLRGRRLGLAVLGSYMANRFAAGLRESLPPAIREALPADQLARMEKNPQALVNPEALEGLRASFADRGPQGAEIVAQLLATLRETLASAIGAVFVVVAVALAVAFVVTIFLREVPLRGPSSRAARKRT